MANTSDDQQGAALLSIPNRIPRSTSHESFATDLSMLSLSSIASDIGEEHGIDIDDTEDAKDQDLAKCRENMMERVLEVNTFSTPRRKNKAVDVCQRRKSSTKVAAGTALTNSEENLIRACQSTTGLANKATLYKSFSTADLTEPFGNPLHPKDFQRRHYASQSLVPPLYAQILLCRRQHLEHLSLLGMANLKWSKDVVGDGASTPGSLPSPSECRSLKRTLEELIDTSSGDNRSSSVENISSLFNLRKTAKPFLRKLKLSKDMGKRIHDDLVRKLGAQKNRSIANVDLERDTGRPVTKTERNFMIFHWLQSLDQDSVEDP